MSERGTKTSSVPVVRATFETLYGRRDPNDFLLRLVSMDEPVYIITPRRQSNNPWSGGIASHTAAKFLSTKIGWKISRLEFLRSRRHPPDCLSSKEPNYQRGVLLLSAGAIEEHFEGKPPRGIHQGELVLGRQIPVSPGTCNPEETGLPCLPMS